MVHDSQLNAAVPGIPFFAPAQDPSTGTAKQLEPDTPTIFRPLKIRGIMLRNRICVSPMCHYSCAASGPQTGVLTPLYYTTIGHYAFRGAALVMLEATGVTPNGRISVNCPGIWNDAQRDALKNLADFVHSQGGLIGLQLGHAGRKASTLAPWVATRMGQGSARADESQGGWPDDVVGPSGGLDSVWDGKASQDPKGGFWEPREMSIGEISNLIRSFAKAAERAVWAGVDVLEVHVAHGYLLHQFVSPITNQRKDKYGGSFENRIRLVLEIIQAVRDVIPESMPLFVRLSATDWMEKSTLGKDLGSWDVPSTIRLAKLLPDLGVDVLDVSSAGNHPQAAHNVFDAGREQAAIAARVKEVLERAGKRMIIGTVGEITDAIQARDLVQEGAAGSVDLISVGRQFLKEPGWVLKVAQELGVDVAWPQFISRPQISQILTKL
ncbi:related to flavin oxidoreductase [Fusarium fujikuroi IMI 58289]|uniref:Related to flavin oxidoreductase n=1 Tax=Gibberella fujikuroi (strain CBS 195.34 / IMI 58289 / NRRL A-6831) TaxID=1279085 RepID=S0EHB9_GIBF5|nr:related to flavin oxidoreductase [Fusarium fujikuroi IMI 58289]KLP06586.1 flavin oxidoreductase [Fusarium fujikuroi]CCT71773.1 related to flavin oxidoreductase [Fusarium fujikuroi IMI 58289]SCO20756.1 related to flavin oxidoreductase [Fusarium fujikuroi]SCO51107.1 related to flavin oxidoreductase [Fusarium fujikuroi]